MKQIITENVKWVHRKSLNGTAYWQAKRVIRGQRYQRRFAVSAHGEYGAWWQAVQAAAEMEEADLEGMPS